MLHKDSRVDTSGVDAECEQSRQLLHVAGVGDVLIRRPQLSDGTWLGLMRRAQSWTSADRWGLTAHPHGDALMQAVEKGEMPPVLDGLIALFAGAPRHLDTRLIGIAFLTPREGSDHLAAPQHLRLGSERDVPALEALGVGAGEQARVRLVVDVAEPYRGLGIGSELARRLIQSAAQSGFQEVQIPTSRLNRSLMAFGERLGFGAQLLDGGRHQLRLDLAARQEAARAH